MGNGTSSGAPPLPRTSRKGKERSAPEAFCKPQQETHMSFFGHIREDIASVMERDPAARSRLEVLLCYPGLWAVWIHRISHGLWRVRLRLLARVLSQFARF